MTDFFITDYGATTGAADNQAAIQAAINACAAAGGAPNHRVRVPAGMFKHSNVILLEHVSLVGTNSLASRGPVSGLFATGTEYRAIRISQSTQARPVIVSDLYVTGSPQSRQPAPPHKNMILSSRRTDSQTHPSYWIIRNNFVEGPNQDPDADDTTPNVGGIFIYGGTNGLIERNTLRFTTADSIHVTRGCASQNILIQYNLIEYPGDDSTAFVTYGSATSTALQSCVSNCTSQYNTSLNSRNGRCFTSIGSVNCKILYNYGENTSKIVPKNNGGKAGVMIAAEDAYNTPGSRNLLVKGNTLKDTGGLGTSHGAIHQYTSGFTFATKPNWVHQNVVIEDNQIISSRRDAFVVNGTDGGTDTIIRNNQTYGLPAGEENISLQPSTIIRRGFINTGNATAATSTYPGNRAIKGIGGAYTTAKHPTDGGVVVTPPPDPEPPPPTANVIKTGTLPAGRHVITFSSPTENVKIRFHKVSGTAAITNFSVIPEPAPVWETSGPGTVTFDQSTLTIAGAAGAVPTLAFRDLGAEFNKKYTLTFTVAGNAVRASIGANGSIVPMTNIPIGNASLSFSSLYSPLLTIERLAAGSAVVSNIVLTKVSDHVWETSGPGTVTVTSNESLTITATAASPATIAIRPIVTTPFREFIWSYTQTGAAVQRSVGITFGGSALSGIATSSAGNNSVRFYAQNSPLAHIRFYTTAAGTTTISNLSVDIVPLDNSASWTLSAGTISQNLETQTVSITGNGTTATTARRAYNTVSGVNYRLLFEVSDTPCAYLIGTTLGGSDIRVQTTGAVGQVEVLFTAKSAQTHLQVQRTGAGTAVITKPELSIYDGVIEETVSPTVASFNDANLGGIGKPYYFIDRLSDSATDGSGNAGSLRYCLESGTGSDRLILNTMQGILPRTGDLNILAGRNNITIAGYTGPGPLVLQGSWNFGIRGQNNVIEHLAFERSYNDRGASNGDGMQIVSTGPRDVNHIAVRNCYTAHSQDEAFQIYRTRSDNGENQSDISLHWNVFTNSLKDPKEFNPAFLSNLNVDAVDQDGDHNFNVLIGGYISNVDLQRNLFANAKQRNPRFSAPHSNSLVANNVIVNWGYAAISFQSESDDFLHPTRNPSNAMWLRISVVGNVGIPGPDTTNAFLVAQSGNPAVLGDVSLIHMSGNSIIQGLNAAITGNATQLGSNLPIPASFPGVQSARQDTLTAVEAIAQAVLMREMELNAGPFPKMRAQNPNLLRGVTNAIAQMKREIAGKHINHETEGPGLSVVPTISRPLTGNLAPPADPTNVAQVQAWLRARRLEVAYD